MTLGTATAIYVAIMGIAVASSGAPPGVHAVDAIGLCAAFWIPAQFVTRPVDVRSQWRVVLGCIVGGTLIWDVLSAYVIVKRELFWAAFIVYPMALVVFTALLLFHGTIAVAVHNGLTKAMQLTAVSFAINL